MMIGSMQVAWRTHLSLVRRLRPATFPNMEVSMAEIQTSETSKHAPGAPAAIGKDLEQRLDEAIEESLPASDPPAITDPRADKEALAYAMGTARTRGTKVVAILSGGLVLALIGWLGRRVMRR
jgi:hypothetical protein